MIKLHSLKLNFILTCFVCVSLGQKKDSRSKKCGKAKKKGRTGKNVTPFVLIFVFEFLVLIAERKVYNQTLKRNLLFQTQLQ